MARDHYVPQFYLRNFHITRRPGHVYLYQRGVSPRPKSVRQVAQEEDYYDIKLDEPDIDKDGVDKLLQMSERTAAPVIKKLLTGSLSDLSDEDFFHLSWFIGLLGSRTPAVRETLASINIGINKRNFKKMLQDEAEFAEMARQHPEMSGEQLENARTAFLKGDIRLDFNRGGQTEDFLMGQQLEFTKVLVDILEHRYWNLVETVSSLSFLTSDNPVINMPTPKHPHGATWGYADGDIMLPISPKRALWFLDRPLKKKVIEIQRSKMPELQFYIITQCRSAVYSHILSKDFQRVLDSTEEGKAQTAIVPESE
jgi:hypothetical protein